MTSPGATAAAVWVDVLPSMSNFGASLAKQAAGAGTDAGKRTGDDMAKATESSFSKGAKAVVAAGAAIGVAVGAAVVKAMSVEAANDKLAAQLGANEQRAAQLGKVAGSLYGQAYGDSLETVNDAIRGVIQSGLVMEDASNARIESITAKVLDLSSAFGQDLAGTTQAVGQIMRTGLAPNADVALDVLTRGFQQGADRSGDLLDTMTEYSGQFQKFGLDAATATGILVQGMKGGARNSDLVADAIKEFSIRAIDGSKTTAEGFAAVGLNAGDMAAKIAAGGPTAAAALDMTLDRLRAIEDPVARDAAAVALFGTQAEDLGAALFALDPSQAAKRLGNVTGAAERMGKTLNDNAQTNLVAFQRQATQAFVTIVGGRVLPIVNTVASVLATVLGPALSLIGAILSATVVPALNAFGTWVRNNQAWLVPLVAGIGAFTLVLHANAIGVAAWSAVTRGAALVTRGWTAAQVLLNAVLYANPITLVVAVLVGLVAAIVVAYQRSETFRAVVQAAWAGIQAAVSAAWSIIAPILRGLWTTLKFIGAVIFTVLVTPFIIAWNAISAAVRAAWNTVLKPIFNLISRTLRNVVAPAVMWLWRNVIRPAFNGIGVIIRFVWNSVIKPIFGLYVGYIRNVIIPLVMSLWNNVIRPAWNGIGAVIRSVWRTVIKPTWDAMGAGLNWVRDRFRNIVDAIGRIWNRLRGALAKPVNFLINTVWNGGILRAWNTVRKWIPGLPEAKRLQPISWAHGGIHEDHTAQIARGGAWRVWAEPETGGEAYIPLAPSKRARSTGVLEQVADRFGMRVLPRTDDELALFADGGLWRRMAGVIQQAVPGTRVTSGYRPGDPGYHGSGRAVDLAGPRSMDMGHMLRVNRHIADTYANSTQLIHTQPGAINLFRGRPHTYNTGTRAQHRDHVHWALDHAGMLRGAQGDYSGGGGAWYNPIPGWIRAAVKSIINPLINRMAKAPPEWSGLPRSLATMLRDKGLDFFLGQAGSGGGGGAVGGPVKEQVRAVARGFGWGAGSQWNAIDALVARESSWNPRAANPNSSARGLFQKMTSIHGPVEATAAGQARWGLNYIRGRYGTPVGALSFHDRNNYYDDGGVLAPGWNLAYNGTRRPEPVLTDKQWQAITRAAGGEGGSSVVGGDLVVHTPAGSSPERLMQTALLELKHLSRGRR